MNAVGDQKKLVGVTGASGHLGGALCRQLVESGYGVRALCHHDRRALADLDIKVFSGDILDAASLDPFLAGCQVVVHCAAIISIAGDPAGLVNRSNVEGTKTVLDSSIRHGVKTFIHVSSTHAVMEQLDRPVFDETNPRKPEGSFPYDRSKAAGEELVLAGFKSGQISGCILRPSSIIGPFDFKPSKLGQAMLDLHRGAIPVLPPGGYNFVDVRDVAAGIIAAIERGKNGETYLVSGHYAIMREFSGLIADCGGKPAPALQLPFGLLFWLLPVVSFWAKLSHSEQAYTQEMLHALRNGHPNMVNAKARAELGWQARPLTESIADFFSWNSSRKGLS